MAIPNLLVSGEALSDFGFEAFDNIDGFGVETFGLIGIWQSSNIWRPFSDLTTTTWSPYSDLTSTIWTPYTG